MMPAAFAYHRPSSLDEALALLAQHGEEARVVAGGHSLIPMMKLRLARPDHLVDLQDLEELRGIYSEPDAFSNAVNDAFAHLGLTHTAMPHDHWRVWKTAQSLGPTED